MKKYTILLIFTLISGNLFSQAEPNEMWLKLSPEIRMNIDKTPLEFRWRPVDVTFLPEKYVPSGRALRTDLMLGVNVWKFKIFSYTKFNEGGNIESGIRLDYNFSLLDKKLLVNIQERFFWGITENASNHYYLIQYIRYKIGDKVTAGVLSYGKWKTGRDFNTGNWFIGPSIDFKLPKNFNFHFAVTKDIFTEPVFMTYLRLAYKFKVNNKDN